MSKSKNASGILEHTADLAEWIKDTADYLEPVQIQGEFFTERDFEDLVQQFLNGDITADELYATYQYNLERDNLSEDEVRGILEGIIEETSGQMQDEAEKLLNGDSDSSSFMRRVSIAVVILYLMSSILGRRTRDVARQSIATGLRNQFYNGSDPSTGKPFGLLYLSRDIQDGRMSKAQLMNRLKMYAQSARSEYWRAQGERALLEGKTLTARVLGIAEHCRDCPQWAAKGFRPIGEIPPPGQGCECRSNCKCSMVYR